MFGKRGVDNIVSYPPEPIDPNELRLQWIKDTHVFNKNGHNYVPLLKENGNMAYIKVLEEGSAEADKVFGNSSDVFKFKNYNHHTLYVKVTAGDDLIAEAIDFPGLKVENGLMKLELVSCTPPNDETSFTVPNEKNIHCIADIKPNLLDATYNSQVEWVITSKAGDGKNQDPASQKGVDVNLEVTANDVPAGRNSALKYEIKTKLQVGDVTLKSDLVTIEQDEIDILRQEYDDVSIAVPGRNEFDNAAPIYPNSGKDAGVGLEDRHEWWIMEFLNYRAVEVGTAYNGILNVTSGYRCPIGNRKIPGSSPTSNHQYGRAFDFDQGNETASQANYDVFMIAKDIGLHDDSYLFGSNGIRYKWGSINPPVPHGQLPSGVHYMQGHLGWYE